MTQRVTFTKASAQRIARVVRDAELGRQPAAPYAPGPRFSNREGKVFRMCTFTGAWAIDTSKVCTYLGVTTTPNTVSAVNVFAEIAGSTATSVTKHAGIAKDGTAWYLIAAEC